MLLEARCDWNSLGLKSTIFFFCFQNISIWKSQWHTGLEYLWTWFYFRTGIWKIYLYFQNRWRMWHVSNNAQWSNSLGRGWQNWSKKFRRLFNGYVPTNGKKWKKKINAKNFSLKKFTLRKFEKFFWWGSAKRPKMQFCSHLS